MDLDAQPERVEQQRTQVRQEVAAFLARDFEQAFAEKRRLEDHLWDVCKFAFSIHIAALTGAVGLVQNAHEKSLNLVPVATTLLAVGSGIGFLLLLILVRNRVYFVAVARYINAQRRLGASP